MKANDADVTLAFASYNVLLSQKAETSQVLTNVPSGALFTDTVCPPIAAFHINDNGFTNRAQ